jgi:hypothetical protein
VKWDKQDPTSPWVGTTMDGWIEQLMGCAKSHLTLQWNFFWMDGNFGEQH